MNSKELDAVRVALQRIQRISAEPADDIEAPAGGAEPGNGFAAMVQRIPLRLTAMLLTGALVVAGIAGWRLAAPGKQAQPDETPVAVVTQAAPAPQPLSAEPPAPAARLEAEAYALLEAGRVREARQSLAGVSEKTAELALILARSFDPNYLRQLANADASADIAEAERWYRAWRDIASENGLVMEPERFDRIIKAMQ